MGLFGNWKEINTGFFFFLFSQLPNWEDLIFDWDTICDFFCFNLI